MAKIDKVLAIYDTQGNRQAIPLYSSLEDVNNLGRKIYYSPTEFAYYPLTEKLDDPNASKKVVVIGTKTYKALLKVNSGFKTILEALDSNGYISAENTHKLDSIDRSVGGEVKINSNTDLNSYNYRAMYTDGSTIKLDDYTTNKYIEHLDLPNLDTERNISYEVPAKDITFGSEDANKYLNYTGNIKTVMSSNYDIINASQLFIGTSTYNTFDSCVFIGNYTSENITDMIENTAGSHLSTEKFVTGHSSNICKIKLGDNTSGAEIGPFYNNANNRLDINTCKINETDKWQFAFMAGFDTIDSNCIKYVTPVTKTTVNNKNELSYKYKSSKNDIKTKSEITSNSNKFKSLIISIDSSFTKDNRTGGIQAMLFMLKILALDDSGKEITLGECSIYDPNTKLITKAEAEKYLKTSTAITVIGCDYEKVDIQKPFAKIVFGNDVLHTILIRPEYIKDTDDFYINTKIIKSSKYNDTNSKTESRTWIYNMITRKVNPDVSRYKNKRALIFNINNIENTRAPLSAQEKSIIEDKRRLLYFSSNLSSGSSIDSNKDLFLFNMFNIMNEKDYNGSIDCGYMQQVIMAPDNMKEQVFIEKVQKVIHGEYDDDAKYYPLNLKSF